MNTSAQSLKRKYTKYAVLLVFFTVVCMFMYAGLQVEHMNIIQTFITEEGGGWSANMTMLPMTIGNLIAIVLTFVFGTLFIKVGIRKIMIPFILLCGLGGAGIALANGLDCFGGAASGSYLLFFISLMIVRCCCPVFQMGGIMLITNWFIKLRGRMASISSIGATLFTIVGTSLMPNVITKSWHGDFRPFYYGIAILALILVLVLGFFLKDLPEEAGLFPDGTDHAPLSETEDQTLMTVKEVLKDKNVWKMTIVLIAAQIEMSGLMSSMAISFMTLGGSDYWLEATVYVSAGAIAGIPCALAFGWLNDRIGSLKTEVIFIICLLVPSTAMLLMPQTKSVPMLILLAAGLALSLGGAPVMGPCVTAYIYGRRRYQSVNRISFAIQLIPAAFAGIMMTALIRSGNAKIAYLILIAITIISFITLLTMMKLPDANAADRK